jgi:sec-independent protein translocase protein TatA
MGNLGAPELILIVLVVLVLFGAKKIPEIAQGFGKGIREFRKASREVQEEIESDESKTGVAEKLACPHCLTPIAKGTKFYPSCGKSLEGTKCSNCNTTNDAGGKYCKECGNQLAS